MPKRSGILSDVLKIAENKERKGRRVLDEILRDCEGQIRRRADIGQEYAVCTIPPVKPGLPAYDLAECVAYVHKKLRRKGFDVRPMEANVLAVEWKRALEKSVRSRKKTARAPEKKHRTQTQTQKKSQGRRDKDKNDNDPEPESEPKLDQTGKGKVALPPLCHEANDLFALPSLRALRAKATALRGSAPA